MKNEIECVVKNCKEVSKSRGLCRACYLSAHNVVNLGKTSWEQLEERGLALNNRKVSYFTREFNKE